MKLYRLYITVRQWFISSVFCFEDDSSFFEHFEIMPLTYWYLKDHILSTSLHENLLDDIAIIIIETFYEFSTNN